MSVSVPTTIEQASAAQAPAPAWPVFETPLIGRNLVASGTMSFTFAKPPDWTFQAGQFVDISLIDPATTDAEGDTRGFSLSSAPSEDVITITTRLRDSAFKRNLQQMPLGTQVRVEGPFGVLTMEDESRSAVVLTGGIGITPFRSILVEAASRGGLRQRVVLIHSNRRPDDAPFLEELFQLAQADTNLSFVPTMTDADASGDWSGERGPIDLALLRRHLQDVSHAIYFLEGDGEPIYYLTGPPGLVRSLRVVLQEAGIDERDIRTEEFTGYD
jgi:ferredoxin-NADP reductase